MDPRSNSRPLSPIEMLFLRDEKVRSMTYSTERGARDTRRLAHPPQKSLRMTGTGMIAWGDSGLPTPNHGCVGRARGVLGHRSHRHNNSHECRRTASHRALGARLVVAGERARKSGTSERTWRGGTDSPADARIRDSGAFRDVVGDRSLPSTDRPRRRGRARDRSRGPRGQAAVVRAALRALSSGAPPEQRTHPAARIRCRRGRRRRSLSENLRGMSNWDSSPAPDGPASFTSTTYPPRQVARPPSLLGIGHRRIRRQSASCRRRDGVSREW